MKSLHKYLILLLFFASSLAQAATPPPARIGMLGMGSHPTDPNSPAWAQLQASLRVLGWVDGKTAVLDPRGAAGSVERLQQMAEELVRSQPAVVFTSGGAEAAAMHKATANAPRKVPVVMMHSIDPVGLGYAQSLRRPGGNMTGLTLRADGMVGKQIEILREAVPRIRRIAIILGAHQPVEVIQEVEQATRKLGLTFVKVLPGKPEEFEQMFARLARERIDAYLAPLDALTFPHRARFCAAAAKARMPGIAETAEYAEAGCFLTYGANLAALSRRAAALGDKILRGANPAELPIEQPTHFDLHLNGKTARALGLTVPPTILVRTEKIVE